MFAFASGLGASSRGRGRNSRGGSPLTAWASFSRPAPSANRSARSARRPSRRAFRFLQSSETAARISERAWHTTVTVAAFPLIVGAVGRVGVGEHARNLGLDVRQRPARFFCRVRSIFVPSNVTVPAPPGRPSRTAATSRPAPPPTRARDVDGTGRWSRDPGTVIPGQHPERDVLNATALDRSTGTHPQAIRVQQQRRPSPPGHTRRGHDRQSGNSPGTGPSPSGPPRRSRTRPDDPAGNQSRMIRRQQEPLLTISHHEVVRHHRSMRHHAHKREHPEPWFPQHALTCQAAGGGPPSAARRERGVCVTRDLEWLLEVGHRGRRG